MFRLFRYYSIASAIAIIVVTVALVVIYRQNAIGELVEISERQNVTLARSFANTVWPEFSSYVTSVRERDGDTLRARPETRRIHETLAAITNGLPVLKIKIYNLDGLTVYSSAPEQIGDDKSKNPGFLKAARKGRPASKLSYRDTFGAFDRTVHDRDLIESYLPIQGSAGATEGVFELYTDVTPLMHRIDRMTVRLVVISLLAFGLLYGVLALIVRRADGILKRQYVDLVRNEETIKSKNTELEHQVAEREGAEAALRTAHDGLEARVRERTEELRREIGERERIESDLRMARDQAESANRAKSEFLAAMSHELRTPLNAIIGFSEMMKTEALGPVGSVEYLEYAKDINDSGLHLLSIINDILDLSKVESAEGDLHETVLEIPALIDSAVMLVRQRAVNNGVALKLEVEDNPPVLRADERKLKQILVNLLSNAVKFTKADGTVTIRVWCRADSGCVFQIADTGIGIAAEDIPKALSRFGQVDGNLNREYEGAGLGLPLTKALVELHGGALDLQSKPGVGTTVTVRFPAARIEREARDDGKMRGGRGL